MTDEKCYEIGAMLALQENVTGPLCRPIGNWLVRAAQETWPRFAGVAWFRRTNVARNWTIVSYHHPARLCWSWSLSVELFKPGYGKGLSRFWYRFGGQWAVKIPWLITIRWHRQSYDWMLSGNAKRRLHKLAKYPRSAELDEIVNAAKQGRGA